jgi:hypothetical protein
MKTGVIISFASLALFFSGAAALQTAVINAYSAKLQTGIAGSVSVELRTAGTGGIIISGSMTKAPASIIGKVFIGSATECNVACVQVGSTLGTHAGPCLGGKALISKPTWGKAT